MNQRPLWLTTAGEYAPLAEPRRCSFAAELKSEIDGGSVVLLEIDPPFSDPRLLPPAVNERFIAVSRAIGNTYSLTQESLSRVFLYDAPLLIRAARILDQSCLSTLTYNRQNLQPLPRGALFRDRQSADRYVATIDEANRAQA
jgi:hypothetical protein